MKKLISIGLVVVLAGGLILAENKRAEAIDPASAALIGASIMLLPILGHIAYEHDYYRHAPYYSGAYPPASYDGAYAYPYPTRNRVYFSAPQYVKYYGGNWNRGYGYERDWRSHRGRFDDHRGRDYDRNRYAGRHYRDRY